MNIVLIAAFQEAGGEETIGGFVVAALGAGEFILGWDESALAGGFQNRRPISLQSRLCSLQSGHGGIQPREVRFCLGNYPSLLRERGYWNV